MKLPLSVVAVIKSDEDYEPFLEAPALGKGSGNLCMIKRFRSGEEALRYLRGEGPRDTVDLIVVGYDLPVTHGGFFGKECRRDPALQPIPIVLLLPEGSDDQVVREVSVISCLQVVEIPSDPLEWANRVRLILNYWSLIRRPSVEEVRGERAAIL